MTGRAMELYDFKKILEQKRGQRQQIAKDLKETRQQVRATKKELEISEEAQTIIQLVAQKTQEELEYRLSELVTLSMRAVFDDPYDLTVKFVIRRGKTECDLLFSKNGQEFDPMSSTGGGVVDIASFALRVALWSLSKPRTRNVLILDEPLRFLSRELQPKASLMLKELSKKLDLQIIMVTHSSDLIIGADKVFNISKVRGVSKVTENSYDS